MSRWPGTVARGRRRDRASECALATCLHEKCLNPFNFSFNNVHETVSRPTTKRKMSMLKLLLPLRTIPHSWYAYQICMQCVQVCQSLAFTVAAHHCCHDCCCIYCLPFASMRSTVYLLVSLATLPTTRVHPLPEPDEDHSCRLFANVDSLLSIRKTNSANLLFEFEWILRTQAQNERQRERAWWSMPLARVE